VDSVNQIAYFPSINLAGQNGIRPSASVREAEQLPQVIGAMSYTTKRMTTVSLNKAVDPNGELQQILPGGVYWDKKNNNLWVWVTVITASNETRSEVGIFDFSAKSFKAVFTTKLISSAGAVGSLGFGAIDYNTVELVLVMQDYLTQDQYVYLLILLLFFFPDLSLSLQVVCSYRADFVCLKSVSYYPNSAGHWGHGLGRRLAASLGPNFQ
jgi:hypothetical protein